MGIFDGFQFDPGTYAPQQDAQGLLDALFRRAAGPISPQYDQMGNATGAQTTPFQPQYVGPAAPQPLAPLPAPINVGVAAAQNPGMIPDLPRQQETTYPVNAQPAQFQGQPAAPQQEVGFGDRLMAGFQGFTQAAGPIQAIGDMVGGFASGATRENQTIKALVAAGIDPGMAQTIAKDRGMLTALMPSLLGSNLKPTWGIVKEDEYGNKQYGWIDPKTRRVTDAAGNPIGGGAVNDATGATGGQSGGDIAIPPAPPGADPKEWRRKWTDAMADRASGKRTEVQQKADQFASRMELAEKNIKGLEGEGTGFSGAANAAADYLPNFASSAVQGEKYQKFSQAKSQFITALLRQESGAAIGKSEFDRYDKEFFPQAGDSATVIEQKREARRVAVEAMRRGAGPGSQSAISSAPSGVSSGGVKWSVVPQ